MTAGPAPSSRNTAAQRTVPGGPRWHNLVAGTAARRWQQSGSRSPDTATDDGNGAGVGAIGPEATGGSRASEADATARRHLDLSAKRLRAAGWKVATEVRRGTPWSKILEAASAWACDVLVCGARHTAGVDRLLLGSVADGLVSRSPVSVLIAR